MLFSGRLAAFSHVREMLQTCRTEAEKSTYLSSTTIADKHELEGRDGGRSFSHGCALLWRGDFGCCGVDALNLAIVG
jgi:hypothetical protein